MTTQHELAQNRKNFVDRLAKRCGADINPIVYDAIKDREPVPLIDALMAREHEAIAKLNEVQLLSQFETIEIDVEDYDLWVWVNIDTTAGVDPDAAGESLKRGEERLNILLNPLGLVCDDGILDDVFGFRYHLLDVDIDVTDIRLSYVHIPYRPENAELPPWARVVSKPAGRRSGYGEYPYHGAIRAALRRLSDR